MSVNRKVTVPVGSGPRVAIADLAPGQLGWKGWYRISDSNR